MAPTSVHSTAATHALADAMRRLAAGGGADRRSVGALEPCFGGRAFNILILLQVYLARLSEAAARPLALASPRCRFFSADERAALRAVGAIAAGNWAAAHSAIDPLVRPDAAESVVAAAAWLAEALADAGWPPLEAPAKPRLN